MALDNEEADLFPSSLLGMDACGRSDRRWWVLCTKGQLEKALAQELFAKNIPFTLPLAEKTSFYLGRTITLRLPLFPRRVFILANEDERDFALATCYVLRSLPVHNQGSLYRELRHLRRLLASGKSVAVERRMLSGPQVRVGSGPLEGVEGRVLDHHGHARLVVGISCLNCGVSIEVEEPMLQRID